MPISSDQITRGYFGLGRGVVEQVVNVKSNKDFLVYIWALNRDSSLSTGGVQVFTPPSQFRGKSAHGPQDALVLDVPAQTGMNLGCIGARGGETINFSSAGGKSLVLFLTVATEQGANVTMTTA